jgi:hypothetical protein
MSKIVDEVYVNSFLQRLKTLQRYCSALNEKYPVGLLFICGPDGKNHKGSLKILKYLFFNAVGKDLFDGVIDVEYSPLEELVLLVLESSVSVIWT